MKSSGIAYHLVAFLVVAIWGSTFVSTKMLLTAGLSPADIFTLRFLVAYVLLVVLIVATPLGAGSRRWLCHSWRDELMMIGLGLTGGSIYFLTENAAMLFTTATNTSLIVCSCPLFTMLIVRLVYREESTRVGEVIGSLISLTGMALVVLNGHFVLHLSPLGDLLAFSACMCWAVYSLIIKQVSETYSPVFVTRKVFFYGLITMLPYYLFAGPLPSWGIVMQRSVITNLLFLGCVASLACFVLWNWVIKHLGPVATTNWVYFNPITTIVFAAWLLGERITPYFLLGTIFILSGMYIAARK